MKPLFLLDAGAVEHASTIRWTSFTVRRGSSCRHLVKIGVAISQVRTTDVNAETETEVPTSC